MGRLIGVEVRRLCARRLARVALLLFVAGLVVGNVVQFVRADSSVNRTRPVPAVERQDGQPVPSDSVLSERSADQADLTAYRMVDEASGDVMAVGIFATLLAFVVGTSFGGAEWAAGTMQSLLFWEPRRLRVMAAKSAALGAVVVLASQLLQLAQLGFSALTAAVRGSTAEADAAFYRELLGTSARLALLAGFAALIAFGIAGLTRNTAAALGIAFAYFAVIEHVIRGLRPYWDRWLLTKQMIAWVQKSVEVIGPQRQGEFVMHELHMGRAGLTLAVYLLVVLGAMALLFARRDVV